MRRKINNEVVDELRCTVYESTTTTTTIYVAFCFPFPPRPRRVVLRFLTGGSGCCGCSSAESGSSSCISGGPSSKRTRLRRGRLGPTEGT
jgi:hypothetical protein